MSVGDGDSGVLPGWYPDPADPARLRRWDGSQWTKDVILAPDDAAVGSVLPPASPSAGQPAPPAPTPPQPSAPGQGPPPGPVPPTPAPPPPPTTVPTAAPPAAASPTAAAAPVPQQKAPSPAPRSTPADEGSSGPDSGSVSLPDWANLPGLTLPPDLSSIDGGEANSILPPPTFEDPLELPAPNWKSPSILAPPIFEQAPEAPATPAAPAASTASQPAPNLPPPAPPQGGRTPGSERYAPPPAGGQYNVPPPPGAPHVPTAGMLPPSSLVSPGVATAAWSSLPQVTPAAVAPVDYENLPRTSAVGAATEPAQGTLTAWAWLIALLPLIQFAVVYLVFSELKVTFAPGMQWGILAAPAALAMLFAIGDRRRLTALGALRPPSPLLAIVPPIYLLTRAIEVGRSSIATLLVWLLLQVGAGAGVYYLLPHLLTVALRAME